MPFVKKIKLSSFNFLCLICLIVILSTCRRNIGIQTIILNKTTHNSYHQNKEEILADNETIIYGNGMNKVSIIAADLEIADLRFRISLIDANQDGYFNTADLDMLVLSPYEQDSVAIDLDRNCVGKLKNINYIQVNRAWFRLLEIDSVGQSLKLVQLEKRPKEKVVAEYCSRWKPLEVTSLKGEFTYLKRTKNLSKKELILVSRMPPLDDSFLQLLEDNKKKWASSYDLTILYMGGYDKTKVNTSVDTISFEFPTFYTQISSCRVINCHANPPYGFLLDKDGTILKEGVKKEEIIRLFKL